MSVKQKSSAKFPRKELPCNFPPSATDDDVARGYGKLITSPEFAALRAIKAAESDQIGDGIDVPGLKAVLSEQIQAVNAGDMQSVEGMLVAQAVSLQTVFSRLIERASCQTSIAVGEALYRVALRAQNQSRATLETLSKVKNPPTAVFAKQANISGGHQQINNTPAHAEHQSAQTQLLTQSHGTTLDSIGATTAGGSDQAVEALGEIHRAAHGGG